MDEYRDGDSDFGTQTQAMLHKLILQVLLLAEVTCVTLVYISGKKLCGKTQKSTKKDMDLNVSKDFSFLSAYAIKFCALHLYSYQKKYPRQFYDPFF